MTDAFRAAGRPSDAAGLRRRSFGRRAGLARGRGVAAAAAGRAARGAGRAGAGGGRSAAARGCAAAVAVPVADRHRGAVGGGAGAAGKRGGVRRPGAPSRTWQGPCWSTCRT
ncbi:MAG: hypothetical protein MZV70_00255 [Desulfobacterales bacterium]|nr:hypothetical protein [Desulfobacterales bacterium]